MRAIVVLATLLASAPAHAAVTPRTSPEWSDLALALFAAGAIWFVRRAMRARFRQD